MLMETAQRDDKEAGSGDPFADFGGSVVDTASLNGAADNPAESVTQAPAVPEFSGDDMPF